MFSRGLISNVVLYDTTNNVPIKNVERKIQADVHVADNSAMLEVRVLITNAVYQKMKS